MTAISHAISAALLHFVWQGLLIALLAWVALAILRNGSARLRYLVSCAALGIMTLAPVVTAWVVYRAPVAEGMPHAVVAILQSTSPAAPSPAALLPTWMAVVEAWALPVWFLGVLVFAARLIYISRHVARLQRSGEAADAPLIDTIVRLADRMGVSGPLRVVISRLTDTPSVVGWLRPVILLPAATLLSLSVEQLEAVLAHELAHIRRHDYLVNLLQAVTETLLFYHPAIWWVSSCVRHERELCCDDLVVGVCGDAIGYARALAKLERLRIIAPGLAMSSTGGSLLFRIRRLTGTSHQQAPSKIPALISLVLVFACFAMNTHWASAQSPRSEEAAVSRDAIWLDTVKYGDLPVKIRALGTIVSPATAELKVPASQAAGVQVGQAALVETVSSRGIIIAGTVSHIESYAAGGTVAVTIDLRSPVPELAGLDIDGTIQVRVLKDVVYVGRPVFGQPNASGTIFKMEQDGIHANRVTVQFGASSVNSIQVLKGLQPGDRLILSDMSKYDGYDRIRLE
ncbi:MAG TPA: M56 family metallopeptidase [Bryobacteraceae bacterium]|nr:M56 family metallopeptidase [Bryobacteraceae bacterium]